MEQTKGVVVAAVAIYGSSSSSLLLSPIPSLLAVVLLLTRLLLISYRSVHYRCDCLLRLWAHKIRRSVRRTLFHMGDRYRGQWDAVWGRGRSKGAAEGGRRR